MPKGQGRTLTSLVAGKLKREITTGRVKPGQPLPSEDELCRKYGVSRVTVRRSLGRLRSERLVLSRPGVGHFVLPVSGSQTGSAGATDVLYVHDLGRTGGAPGPVSSAIFSGAIEESAKHGLDVMQCCLAPDRLRTIIQEKSESSLRGVLFDWNDPALARFMIGRGVPFVVVEGDFDNIPVAAVVQDDAAGTLAAMEHLAAHGHRRIAYLGLDDTWVHRRRRLAAFRQFHMSRNAALPEERVAFAPFQPTGDGRPEAQRLLAAPDRPTALYVANRELLAGALEIAGELGLDVPGELSVVVWGDPEPGDAHPDVDFISWDRREMGRMAVRVLADRASRGERERMQVLIPAKLEARGSTAEIG